MQYGVLVYRQGDGRNQQYILKLGGNAIGRAPENNLVLDNTDVSRFHARIICTANGARIADLGSRNGTRVNNVALEPNVEQPLQHLDRIEIGPFVVLYVNKPRPAIEEVVGPPPPGIVVAPAAGDGFVQPSLQFTSKPVEQTARKRSSYLRFLPPIYAEYDNSGLLNSILLAAESILAPLDSMIAQLDSYFDPYVAPESMLPWLAFWVDLVLDENLPIERRRALITQASSLYRRRGTRAGLRDYLAIYTGVTPIIVEPGREQLGNPDSPLDKDVRKALKIKHDGPIGRMDGQLRRLIQKPLRKHTFRVILLPSTNPKAYEKRWRQMLEQIIEAEKPAHTDFELVIY